MDWAQRAKIGCVISQHAHTALSQSKPNVGLIPVIQATILDSDFPTLLFLSFDVQCVFIA